MSIVNLKSIIECLIFVSETPLTLAELIAVLDDADRAEIKKLLAELAEEYQRDNHSFVLAEVAGGWQFRTRPEFSGWVRRLIKERPSRLSRPAMEVLAIIAYKQPITRAAVDQMRGVDSSGVVKTLIERHFVKIIARDEQAVGRPLLYGTTRDFLEAFGFNSLAELPALSEVEEVGKAGGNQLELIAEARPETFAAKARPDAPPPQESATLDDVMPFEREEFSDEDHEVINEELADIFKHIKRHQPEVPGAPGAEAGEPAPGDDPAPPLEAVPAPAIAAPAPTEPAAANPDTAKKPEEQE